MSVDAPAPLLVHRPLAPSAPGRTPRRLGAGSLTFGLAAAVYLALGAVLVLGHDSIAGDALARVSNAHQVLFARDSKLSAIGFVWSPLPSLLEMPLLLLDGWWPALASRGFAGVIESALFMAAFVVTFRGILLDLRVRGGVRVALVVLVAVNPLIAYYGANGMSEAMLLFFATYAVRHLLRWWDAPGMVSLARAALGLALGYWSRYELIGAAAAATVVVLARTWQRTSAARTGEDYSAEAQRAATLADGLVIGFPAAVSFVLWALLSWVIVGQPFAQFSSQYGNSSLVRDSGSAITDAVGSRSGARVAFVGEQLFVLAPVLVPVALICLVVSWRRRDGRPFVPALVLGSVLGVQGLVLLSGSSFGWLRYQITVIPLLALLLAFLLPTEDAPRGRWSRPSATGVLLLTLAAGLPSTINVLSDQRLAREEAQQLVPVVRDELGLAPVGPDQLGRFAVQRQVAAALDAQHLPDGSVLTDVANAFAVVLSSQHAKVFVTTTDTDFRAAVADPAAHHVRYLLVSDQGRGTDALQVARPALYDTGAGIATVVRTFPATLRGGASWRLLQVND